MDNLLFVMFVIGKYVIYDVEEKYVIVLERYKCYFVEY